MLKTLLYSLQVIVVISLTASISFAERQQSYGGFSPDSLQVFYDYIHGQEMMAVQASDSLYQTIRALPLQLEAAIDLEQEAELRSWLYDFLVAFSESGSDSLVAAFYMREGVNYPQALVELRQYLLETVKQPIGESPVEIFSQAHKILLDQLERDYYFGKVSFYDSVFRIFEMKDNYETYESYAEKNGMTPTSIIHYGPRILPKIEQGLVKGEKHLFADIMFIVEEPEKFMKWKTARRTPMFFRLVWDEKKKIWRHLEIFFSHGIEHIFLFL